MKKYRVLAAGCLSLAFFVGCGDGVEDVSSESLPEDMTIEDESAAMEDSYKEYGMETGERKKKK
ncbi:MAG: hypothetical protein ABGZ23_21340 [Fuerstiella sp.]|nr:hypothetical protein [Fuerstiella sp.]